MTGADSENTTGVDASKLDSFFLIRIKLSTDFSGQKVSCSGRTNERRRYLVTRSFRSGQKWQFITTWEFLAFLAITAAKNFCLSTLIVGILEIKKEITINFVSTNTDKGLTSVSLSGTD